MDRREFALRLSALLALSRGAAQWQSSRLVSSASATTALSPEAMGWLAHLHRKVSLGGTWNKGDTVGPQWDTVSFAPTMHYARYELTWLSWSMGLMAESTPAWREEYARILGFLADRYLEYWSFYEWVEHRGDDPKRSSYPAQYARMLPKGQFGQYNLPGWAGNGSRSEAYDPDPIRAGGRFGLMYKGYLNLVLSMYRYVSDDGKYDRPFELRYDDTQAWTYDHRSLNQLLADQWRAHEEGIACEVTKVYPWCNTLSGAGTRLYDAAHGTHFADAYYRWQRFYAQHYVGSDSGHGPDWLMGYYDPDLKIGVTDHGQANVANWVPTIWHGLAMDARLFTPLWETLRRTHLRPQPDGSAHFTAAGGTNVDLNLVTGLGAAMAREMGDNDTADALMRWITSRYEPLRDTARGEFAYGFGLNEPWPRGQYNAWVMPAHLVTHAGQWRGIFQRPNFAKFAEPTVAGVDFPAVRVRVARYDASRKRLDVELAAGIAASAGRATEFKVTRLPRGARYSVVVNNAPGIEQQAVDGTLTIRTTPGERIAVFRNG
jgi:Linalool dehydratase/isomerase